MKTNVNVTATRKTGTKHSISFNYEIEYDKDDTEKTIKNIAILKFANRYLSNGGMKPVNDVNIALSLIGDISVCAEIEHKKTGIV